MIDLLDKNGKVSSAKLSSISSVDELAILKHSANWPNETEFIERVHAYITNRITYPTCNCGNKLAFRRGKYLTTCGAKACAAIVNRPRQQISETMRARPALVREYIAALTAADRWIRYSIAECLEYYEMVPVNTRWYFTVEHADFICNLRWYTECSSWNVREMIKMLHQRCTRR
jgi:hypothetical protein